MLGILVGHWHRVCANSGVNKMSESAVSELIYLPLLHYSSCCTDVDLHHGVHWRLQQLERPNGDAQDPTRTRNSV